MMSLLSILDKKIGEERAALAKDQALLANLDAPRIRVEQSERRLAGLEAQRAAEQVEVEQITAERADVASEIDQLAYAKDVTALVKALEPADRYRSGRFHDPVYSRAIAELRNDHERYQTLQQRLVGIDRRLKELGQ